MRPSIAGTRVHRSDADAESTGINRVATGKEGRVTTRQLFVTRVPIIAKKTRGRSSDVGDPRGKDGGDVGSKCQYTRLAVAVILGELLPQVGWRAAAGSEPTPNIAVA